ncbi:MAG: bifunctional folylpolyglutamate synthase/dihydrofolate synthase, partial [Crocinitomicaceae bacterium]
MTFAMAILHFSQKACTWVVLETGVGGRLDATNVVRPEISIITNIGLDHTQFLGHTLEAIAIEKAGIIKPNVPVVIGKRQNETFKLFEQVAKNNNAPIYFAEDERSTSWEIEKLDLPLYQVSNLRTALTSLKILGFNVQHTKVDSLLMNLHQHTGIFGRLTKLQEKPAVYLDVSHNVDGIKETLRHIKPKGKLHIIYGCSQDKNTLEILSLFPQN